MNLKEKFDYLSELESTHSREDLGFVQENRLMDLFENWNELKVSPDDLQSLTSLFIYLNTYWLNKAKFKSNLESDFEVPTKTAHQIIDLVSKYSNVLFKATDVSFHLMQTKRQLYFKLSCNISGMDLNLNSLPITQDSVSIENNILTVKRHLEHNLELETERRGIDA